MVERICPQCQHGNPVDNRYCGQCGAPMERNAIAPAEQTDITLFGAIPMPMQLKQVGRAVAVGLVTLAAEASLAWIRHKIENIAQSSHTPRQSHTTPPVMYQTATPQHVVHTTTLLPSESSSQLLPTMHGMPSMPGNVVTIISQRIVETWEHGTKTKQTVERNVWQRKQE